MEKQYYIMIVNADELATVCVISFGLIYMYHLCKSVVTDIKSGEIDAFSGICAIIAITLMIAIITKLSFSN